MTNTLTPRLASDAKPRDVQFIPIALDTFILRSRTWDRLKFEVEYSLQKGTTANSYIIQADKTALFDPPGESFTAKLPGIFAETGGLDQAGLHNFGAFQC